MNVMTVLKSLAALIVLVIANAALFGGILWNRSGEPTGQLALDQCAFGSIGRWYRSAGVPRYLYLYAVSADLTGVEAAERRDGTGRWRRPEWRYVVLQRGGPKWEDYVTRETSRYPHINLSESRLILVDGSRDAEALMAKYPDRTNRAIVVGGVWPGPKGYWTMASTTIAIESQYRTVVREIQRAREAELKKARKSGGTNKPLPCTPSHRITITWGRRFEPWISAIEPL
jgi:hypothetical protein